MYVSYAYSQIWEVLLLLIDKNKLNTKKIPGEMTGVQPHVLFHGHRESVSFHSLHWNPCSVLLSQVINFKLINPQFPKYNSGKGINCFFYQQTVTDRIRSLNKGTFSCVSVVVSIMFNNYQTFANFICT